MRKSVSILLLMLVTQLLVATNAFFAPYPSSFNVDLSDTDTYCGVPDSLSFVEGFAKGYSDQTMIALLGLSDMTIEREVTWNGVVTYPHIIELKVDVESSDDFEYISASEPYLSRPFQLDIVENYKDGGTTKRIMLEASGSGKVATYTTGLFTAEEVWFDIVLRLPTDGLSNALAKNDYYVQLKISAIEYEDSDNDGDYDVKVGEYGPWPFYISGYIDEGSPANVSYVMMNIAPTARANAINIDELKNGPPMKIADYFYESMAFMPTGLTDIYDEGSLSYSDQAGNPLYVFASSSSDPNAENADSFKMKMAGFEDEDNLSSAFSFPFAIEMRNVNYDSAKPDENCKTFTGETPTSINEMLMGSSQVGETGDQHDKDPDWSDWDGEDGVIYFYDDGEIYIKLPDNYDSEELNDLTAGVYTSRIYIHVVSAN